MNSILEHLSYQCDEDDNFVLEKVAAAYNIDHASESTVESIEAELIAAQNTNEFKE